MKSFLFISLGLIGSIGLSFAQYSTLLPKQGDKIQITTTNQAIQSNANFKWFNYYAVYSGRDISFKAKTPLTEKPQILTKSSKIIMFNSGIFPNASFPFVSNIIPQVGSLGVVSQVYVVDNDAGTYIGNPKAKRSNLAGQLCIEAVYRTIDITSSTSKAGNAYFIAKTADKASESYTLSSNDNILFTTDKPLTGCDNYFVGYCGDGVVDKKTGDATTDGVGGILVDGNGVTWSLAPTTDEVCDDGADNGKAGKCKTDCSGIGGTPTGTLTVTKSISNETSYTTGNTVNFVLTLTNTSAETITNITLTDYLPSMYQYLSSTPANITIPSTSTGTNNGLFYIQYSGMSLGSGQTATITVSTKLLGCDITKLNSVSWTSSNGNGQTTKSITCTTPTSLQFTKTGPASIPLGGYGTFVITLKNTTAEALTNLSIQDVWGNTSCMSIKGAVSSPIATLTQGDTWGLARLEVGSTLTITLTGQASTSTTCLGDQINTANLTYNTVQKESTNVRFRLDPASQTMSITKTHTDKNGNIVTSTEPVKKGERVRFKIGFANIGTVSLAGIKVTDIRPKHLKFETSTLKVRLLLSQKEVRASVSPYIDALGRMVFDLSSYTFAPGDSGYILVSGTVQ